MARAYAHLPFDERLVSYIDARCHELREVIRDATNEMALLEELKARQNLCDTCNGKGKLRCYLACDESVLEPCPTCKGSGKEAA